MPDCPVRVPRLEARKVAAVAVAVAQMVGLIQALTRAARALVERIKVGPVAVRVRAAMVAQRHQLTVAAVVDQRARHFRMVAVAQLTRACRPP